MKKVLIALALLVSVQAVNAQIKSDADIQKAIDKAEAVANDAKKGAKPAAWMKLGQAYLNAYNNPTANITQGIDKATFALMAGEKPVTTEIVELDGQAYEKQVLSHANVYFNQAGQLVMTEVTKPSYDGDALGKAAAAFVTAYEKGAKEKDIDAQLQAISARYYDDAISAYTFGDLSKASDLFGKAAEVSLTAPCSKIDTNAVYNTAFTAVASKDYARARQYYNKCLDLGYTSEGSVYAALSDCALADKDTVAAKNYLAEGMKLYPDNASVLTNLINLYLSTNEDPVKIVELLDEAKKQMPDNASLYYVEGNIYRDLKKYDEAIAAYRKASSIDPNYEWGHFGEGIIWMNKAVDINEEANNLPYNEYRKFDELQKQVYDCFKEAIAPLEKCYEMTQNADLKELTADNLKRVFFNLRNQGDEYKAGYEKYNAILGGE